MIFAYMPYCFSALCYGYVKLATGPRRSRRCFYDYPNRMIWFNPQLGLIVASLDKMLHNDYLCLVASKKQ